MSSGPAAPLTPVVLEAWREACRAVGAPIASALSSRFTAGEAAALVRPLGLSAPPELATFWAWGAAAPSAVELGGVAMNPTFTLLAPEDAVRETASSRARWREEAPADHERWWRDDWLIVARGAGADALLLDTSAPGPLSPPLYSIDADPPQPIGPSLGALFAYWTTLITSGEHVFQGGEWLWSTGEPGIEVPGGE